jgi:site-specific recombinase XerD
MNDAVFFTARELQRLFLCANEDASVIARTRNVALLALLSQAGLRVHEVVGLSLAQVDISQEMLVGIRGKGDTVADIPISPEVAVVISRWLNQRSAVAHASENALFVSRLGRRISIRSVERVITKLRSKAGIAKHGSCHSLRHSMATISLELGADIGTISEILRHSSVAITQRYLHCLDGRRRDAVRRLATTIPREVISEGATPVDGSIFFSISDPKKVIDDQGVWDDVVPKSRAA